MCLVKEVSSLIYFIDQSTRDSVGLGANLSLVGDSADRRWNTSSQLSVQVELLQQGGQEAAPINALSRWGGASKENVH